MAGEDLTRAGPRRARPAAAGLAVAGPAVARPGIVSRRRRLPRAVDRCLLLLPPLPLLLLLQMIMMLLLPLLLASTGDLMTWPMVERNQRSRLGMPSTSIACAAAVILLVYVVCLLCGGALSKLTIETNRAPETWESRYSLEITDRALFKRCNLKAAGLVTWYNITRTTILGQPAGVKPPGLNGHHAVECNNVAKNCSCRICHQATK